MGTRLYVGNLPYNTDEAGLRSLFGQEGRAVTEVKIMTDRDTGQSRGFGFVEMSSNADAEKAIAALNGFELGGRSLVVNEARERERSGGGGGGFGGGNNRGGGGGDYGGRGGRGGGRDRDRRDRDRRGR